MPTLPVPDGPQVMEAVGVESDHRYVTGLEDVGEVGGERGLPGAADAVDPDSSRMPEVQRRQPVGDVSQDVVPFTHRAILQAVTLRVATAEARSGCCQRNPDSVSLRGTTRSDLSTSVENSPSTITSASAGGQPAWAGAAPVPSRR